MRYFQWRPYVPVAARRRNARRAMDRLRKKGVDIQPVEIAGRKIAHTFWGEAWCEHLEKFSDFANRLPRGRTYVRNGSVCHLAIEPGAVEAKVSGSEIYDVAIAIEPIAARKWADLKKRCAGRIGSLLEILQGRLSKQVMGVVTHRTKGLFPQPKEIELRCSCPDWAVMCKHVAAVLYGVGARLDERPELLFELRGVDPTELITLEAGKAVAALGARGGRRRVADEDLADVFGIELLEEDASARTGKRVRRGAARAKAKAGTKAKAKRKAAGRGRPKGKARAKAKRKAKARPARAGARPKTGATKRTEGASRRAPRSHPISARGIARLRRKFGMSRPQFARLLGVSVPTIANWENATGRLQLQMRTRIACEDAAQLTREEAWERLDGA